MNFVHVLCSCIGDREPGGEEPEIQPGLQQSGVSGQPGRRTAPAVRPTHDGETACLVRLWSDVERKYSAAVDPRFKKFSDFQQWRGQWGVDGSDMRGNNRLWPKESKKLVARNSAPFRRGNGRILGLSQHHWLGAKALTKQHSKLLFCLHFAVRLGDAGHCACGGHRAETSG